MEPTIVNENRSFGGRQLRYRHHSEVLHCDMHFSIFLPPQAETGSVPVLYWLSGLTCTDENFVQKAGAQRIAAELGIAIVSPDTSPRGEHVPDDPENSYDFGHGAGFYLNATQAPWSEHYHMYDYITAELPTLINNHFPVNPEQCSIFGHSMGGHGALTIALRNPGRYQSVSAFAPICSPSRCPWGQNALKRYLGEDESQWATCDTTRLILSGATPLPTLVDQGKNDEFLETHLQPELLVEACRDANYPIQFRLQPEYDHSYFFIASFMEEHLRFHAKYLSQS